MLLPRNREKEGKTFYREDMGKRRESKVAALSSLPSPLAQLILSDACALELHRFGCDFHFPPFRAYGAERS